MILVMFLVVIESLFSVDNLIQIIGVLAIMFVWKGKTDEKLKAIEMKIEKIESSQEKLENLVVNITQLQKDVEYIKDTDKTQNDRLLLIENNLEITKNYGHEVKGTTKAIFELLKSQGKLGKLDDL